jgi:hypothetical protein
VQDGTEQAEEQAQFLPICFVAERLVGDNGLEHIDLADRDEMIPLANAA